MDVEISREDDLDAAELVELLRACGMGSADDPMWPSYIELSLCVVTARAEGRLVGVGFVSGNGRHVELVDGNVHPDFRMQGIHNALIEERLEFCSEINAKYIGITWDKKSPWLHEHYEDHGFRDIDFAMWHESSLTSPDDLS